MIQQLNNKIKYRPTNIEKKEWEGCRHSMILVKTERELEKLGGTVGKRDYQNENIARAVKEKAKTPAAEN